MKVNRIALKLDEALNERLTRTTVVLMSVLMAVLAGFITYVFAR
jgi:hypothetical protein